MDKRCGRWLGTGATMRRSAKHAVEWTYGDLRNPEAMLAAVRGCERVFHCAASIAGTGAGRHRELFETNVLGTRNILRAARKAGVARVVVTGSFSAIGHRPRPPEHRG